MRPEFINQIKAFEGFRPNVYKCPGGYYTIGYGHVIKRPQAFATGIHTGEAHVLLCQDLEKARQAVLKMVRVPLTLSQEEALTSFVFNLGAMAFHRSTLRAKINRGNHQAVPEEMRRWVFCAGQKLSGLVKRREWEAAWYISSLLSRTVSDNTVHRHPRPRAIASEIWDPGIMRGRSPHIVFSL